MKLYADTSTVDGACGMGVYYNFSKSKTWDKVEMIEGPHCGGAGYVCAGFVENDKISDEAFKQLSEKFTLVFRTKTRQNKNSGNKFYFAIFDTKDKCKYGFDAVDGYDDDDDEDEGAF